MWTELNNEQKQNVKNGRNFNFIGDGQRKQISEM